LPPYKEWGSLFEQAWQGLPLLYDYQDEAPDFVAKHGFAQKTDFIGWLP
jgi:hypothetical protein